MNNSVGISKESKNSFPQPNVGAFSVAEDSMKTKKCRVCGEEKTIDCFGKNSSLKDGLQPQCNKCRKRQKKKYRIKHKDAIRKANKQYRVENWKKIQESQRQYSKKNREEIGKKNKRYRIENWVKIAAGHKSYSEAHPERIRAVSAINHGIRDGKVVRPTSCSRCGDECKPQGHHPDYSEPLKVVWLCTRCHKRLHADLNRLEK